MLVDLPADLLKDPPENLPVALPADLWAGLPEDLLARSLIRPLLTHVVAVCDRDATGTCDYLTRGLLNNLTREQEGCWLRGQVNN